VSLADSATRSTAPARLFVTGDDATTRRITNYVEVESFLVDRGYTPTTVGALDLAAQIRTFANACEVVGIAGSAMTNMLFCAPGTRITVIAPASMPALHFWDFATQCGHDFRIGYFPTQTPARQIHSNFTVDLNALASLLVD
jgi:capsular polysaccharide biosynthesis protein